MKYYQDTVSTVEAMEKFGGSFVQQMAKLWTMADQMNKRKLERAFAIYFSDYFHRFVEQKNIRPTGQKG